MFVYFYSFQNHSESSDSQRVQWSHLTESQGPTANSEEAISLKCRLVIVLVLGSCGMLTQRESAAARISSASHFVIWTFFGENFHSNIVLFQDDGELDFDFMFWIHLVTRLERQGYESAWYSPSSGKVFISAKPNSPVHRARPGLPYLRLYSLDPIGFNLEQQV